jgi:hypothetical protein
LAGHDHELQKTRRAAVFVQRTISLAKVLHAIKRGFFLVQKSSLALLGSWSNLSCKPSVSRNWALKKSPVTGEMRFEQPIPQAHITAARALRHSRFGTGALLLP